MAECNSIMSVGMATLDLLYELPCFPSEGSVNLASRQEMVVGGPTGRSAIAAARLGGDVTQLSMIGNDCYADLLRELSARERINIRWFQRDEPSQNSVTLVAIDSEARTTIWRPQPRVSEEMLRAIELGVPLQSAVLVDATDPSVLQAVRDACRESGVPSLVDTGSYKSWSISLLHGIDHIAVPVKFMAPFMSDCIPEAQALPLVEQVATALEYFDAESFCVTCGPEGGVVATKRAGIFEYRGVRVETVDSCGAGDTFHGALLWAIGEGLELPFAYATASWAAGLKCAQLGNAGIPSRDRWITDQESIAGLVF